MTACALALPLSFPGQAGQEALLAASALSLLAGLLDFLSRSKKEQTTSAPEEKPAGAPADQAPPTPALDGELPPPTGKYSGKKGKDDQPPRPRPAPVALAWL